MTGYAGTDTTPETLTPELPAIANAPPERLGGLIEQYLRSVREDLLKMWEGSWRWLDDGTDLVLQYFNTTTNAWTNTNVKMTQSGVLYVDSLVISKSSGKGIKVDLATPTFGWRDLKGKVTQRNTGASKPAHNTWFGGLKQYQFAAGKEEYFTFHIDHDHFVASDIFLHVHWSHINGFVTGGTITFEYEISYAKGFSQGAFGTPVSTTFAGTATTIQRDHVVSEIQISATTPDANQIDSDDLEPDGIIECRIKVTSVDITVSEGGVPDPFIHEADIHYQSTSMGTKQKAPDFYT